MKISFTHHYKTRSIEETTTASVEIPFANDPVNDLAAVKNYLRVLKHFEDPPASAPDEMDIVIPDDVWTSPAKFRIFLLNYGNHTFIGGQNELSRIFKEVQELPRATPVAKRRFGILRHIESTGLKLAPIK